MYVIAKTLHTWNYRLFTEIVVKIQPSVGKLNVLITVMDAKGKRT